MRPILPALLMFLLAACGGDASDGARGGSRAAPLVTVAMAAPARFVDRIDAVGTARANEQVTVSAPVTERILKLNFEDGGYVQRGQVIATLARGQETAQLEEAQAQARVAGQQLNRLQQLKARGFATNASVDTQVAAASIARAQAAAADAAIGDRVVRAPFSGQVSLRMISAGAVVQAGTEIATISDLSRIKLDFPVPETLLASIKPGQAIEARAAAYPDRPFRGTIATIDSVVDPATRSVVVRAVLNNGDRMLKPGMLLSVAIESDPRTAIAVPELSVVGEGEERYVFVIDAGGNARRTPVKTGIRRDGMIEILSGLRAGQRVVGEGVVKVTDGIKVRTGAAKAAAARVTVVPYPRGGGDTVRSAELDPRLRGGTLRVRGGASSSDMGASGQSASGMIRV
ncbi:efflux RND transporter periplasmic adaptor subunit [Sphingomonas arantia]|uniref:Efflux RND transporter periplasmic adaptor subunit n=1 Tax=Sphingomonas arantia TaxID=1460676 RepID=A0ABW4TV59_9SPHN